jgi:hypothetical protein
MTRYPTLSTWCIRAALLHMHQVLRLHQMHQGVCREKKKYPFFSFFYGQYG